MKRYLWPIGAMMATVLAGVAVLVVPLALHLNGGTTAAETMVWSGIGVVVVGLLALMAWQRELTQAVAEALPKPVAVEEPAQPAVPQEVPSAEERWEAELNQLAAAVLLDLKAATATPKPVEVASAKPKPIPRDDLEAVASALLRDLSGRMDYIGVDSGRRGQSS